LELTEYSLTYQSLKSLKGQIIADFIVDHSMVEESLNFVDVQPWRLYFDSSSHRNGTGVEFFIISPENIPTKFKFRLDKFCSNNEAEYEALIAGLEILLELGAKHVEIKGKSELVVKQLTKEYKCVKENLIIYFVTAKALLKHFDWENIQHVPRIENQEAHDLAQIASGYKISEIKFEELIKIREKLALKKSAPIKLPTAELGGARDLNRNGEIYAKIFAIDNLSDKDWRKPIVEYLQNPTGKSSRKTRYRALSYVIVGNELLKKTPEGVLLKCLNETEEYLAMSSTHSGACGSHQAGHKMKWFLFRQGVYWPSMLKDCIDFTKRCQECQVHAGIQHVPASELHSIVKPWPFGGWALDVIGKIKPGSSGKHKHILVGIDYFTKWVEVIPLREVNQDAVISFIQKHILYRFGIP